MKGGLVRRSGLVFADDERAESACGRVGSQRAECVWGLSVGSSARGALLFTEEQREEEEVREREKEDWKKKGVRDMLLIERGGAVECTSEETQPLHLDFFQDWEQ